MGFNALPQRLEKVDEIEVLYPTVQGMIGVFFVQWTLKLVGIAPTRAARAALVLSAFRATASAKRALGEVALGLCVSKY